MPYLPAQRTAPDGTVYEEEEPIPEPAPLVSHAENVPGPVMPASEYYGGETSALPPPDTHPADRYYYDNANNPNYVQTTYPGTGAPTTTRYIPPPGSTYPAVEVDRALPPRPTIQEMQEQYPRAYPDIEPYWPGEGGRDAPPPPDNARYVPAATHNALVGMYYSGEGAMGRGDPLDPRNQGIDDARYGQYRRGPGETTGWTRWRPGHGLRSYVEGMAARGGPPAPPPGYVPELVRGPSGNSVSTYWEEQAPFPDRYAPQGMPPPPNQPPALPRGGSPYNDAYAITAPLDVLAWMEYARRRRRRRPFTLQGLFGSRDETLDRSGG